MASGVDAQDRVERRPIHLQGTMLVKGHWGESTWGNWGVGGSDISSEVMVGCPDWLVGLLVCLKKKKMCVWGGGGLERWLGADMCIIHN